MYRRNQVGVLSDVKALVKTREVHYCPQVNDEGTIECN